MSRKTADARLSALRAMPYEKYLLSPEWKERRKVAIDWARNACQLCNSDAQPLHVHHRTYDRLGAELPADLVVLCSECHEKVHPKRHSPPPCNAMSDAILTILEMVNNIQDRQTRLMLWQDRHDAKGKK